MPGAGGRLGKGLYLADQMNKSGWYVSPTSEGTGVMFLAEAALGKQHVVHNDNRVAQSFCSAPAGFDSVVTSSQTRVNPQDDVTLEIDGNRVRFATGRPEEVVGQPEEKPSSFGQAEYLCYDAAQVRLRYLVLVGKPKAGLNGDVAAAVPSAGGGAADFAAGDWFWAGDSDGNPGGQDAMIQYSDEQSARFEAAFLSGAASVKVDEDRYIDLSSMAQCRINDPSRARSVIRV